MLAVSPGKSREESPMKAFPGPSHCSGLVSGLQAVGRADSELTWKQDPPRAPLAQMFHLRRGKRGPNLTVLCFPREEELVKVLVWKN